MDQNFSFFQYSLNDFDEIVVFDRDGAAEVECFYLVIPRVGFVFNACDDRVYNVADEGGLNFVFAVSDDECEKWDFCD